MELPTHIEGVLSALDEIIEITIEDDNFLGIFAYVYRRTTAEIKHRIELGEFQDNDRMQNMDVEFANLYIKAFHDYRDGKSVSSAWQLSFDQSTEQLALLQHLLLGMNAHINMDLAIAASSISRGQQIEDLEADFKLVNRILGDITDEMQHRLSRVSPLLFLLDLIGQRSDEKLADFSIEAAREFSWQNAVDLWSSDPDAYRLKVRILDKAVTGIGNRFINPRTGILKFILSIIGHFESSNKQKILRAMQA